MSAPEPVRVHVLRNAVIQASDRRTLRAVAAEIGMSHSGLFSFIEGGEPRSATLKKLQAWYIKHAAEPGGTDADAVEAALAVLLDGIPNAEMPAARERLMAEIRDSFKRTGAPPPVWLCR